MVKGYTGISETGILRDANGQFLYQWNRPYTRFNLPADLQFTVSAGQVKPCEPVKFDLPKVPEIPRHKVVLKEGEGYAFAIEFAGRKTVILRPVLFTYPAFVQVFIYLHETAHLARRSYQEHDCDRFAAVHMLRQGWNPSQIWGAAATLTLISPDRVERLGKFLEKWRRT